MAEKTKKYQQPLVVVLILLCMGIIMAGGIKYVEKLRHNLQVNAVQSLMAVTVQQEQAFDTLVEDNWDRLHGFTEYFVRNGICDPEEVRQLLTLPNETDATYLVACLDDGWVCSTYFDDIRQLDEQDLNTYRSLSGVGVRDNYTGTYSGAPRFGYYEIFTFADGCRGMIQKSYDRSKVAESFSLSFYNDQGRSYVVNRQGDILLRPTSFTDGNNIFDLLVEKHERPQDADRLREALAAGDTGSLAVSGSLGEFICTYIPIGDVDGWYLVSFVPTDVITEESHRMLMELQLALGLLILVLFICALFVLLAWRTQRALHEQEKAVQYQTQLFDIFTTYLSGNTDDVYMILDHKTSRLEHVSPNVARVLGLEPEQVLEALQIQDMDADPEAARAYYREINNLVPGKSAASRYTERVHAATGERRYFWENTYCVPVQGEIKRICCLSDRTRERKSQNDLAEALHMAQAASDAKTSFLSSVSHDIRTPMNAIIGFLALMRDEADNPDTVREYTQRIDAASQHLLGLINDVLDMNKIERGGTTLSISEMNLAVVIEEINTIIRPQARAREQSFDIFVSHMSHEDLLGDKMRINQVLINLLSNAVKYTQKGGNIQLRVEELSQVVDNYSRIRFTVSDNGLGMSESYQKVIFEPFTREETKITHEIQGTGLGMAITKRLVDLMGGSIRVESMLGEGSTFTVELELRIQEKERDGDITEFWSSYSVAKMLVTDDEEEVCRNIVKAMSNTGVACDYSTDGEAAVRMMQEHREAGHPYDLILLDWQMPNLDGLETARLIRERYSKKIPILLLTAYDWSEIEQEAMEIGINHFMPKPFFMSTFKDAIRRVMGSQNKKEETEENDVVRDKRILVVDDIEVNRIILTKILTTLGASCDTAGNGQEAADKFEASQPGTYDLILMDVQMPVMDGYTATRTIRSGTHPEAKTVPIIAMTANAFVDDVREAIESGMDAHIAKPVQIETLKTTVRQVLDSRRVSV